MIFYDSKLNTELWDYYNHGISSYLYYLIIKKFFGATWSIGFSKFIPEFVLPNLFRLGIIITKSGQKSGIKFGLPTTNAVSIIPPILIIGPWMLNLRLQSANTDARTLISLAFFPGVLWHCNYIFQIYFKNLIVL